MEGRRGGEADGDAAGLAARGAAGADLGVLDLGQDRLGIGQERAAGVGQGHAARMALEQLGIDLAFERADLLGKRRLLHAELLRGARDMALMRDDWELVPDAFAIAHCTMRVVDEHWLHRALQFGRTLPCRPWAFASHGGSSGSIIAGPGHSRQFRTTLAPDHASPIQIERKRGNIMSVQAGRAPLMRIWVHGLTRHLP